MTTRTRPTFWLRLYMATLVVVLAAMSVGMLAVLVLFVWHLFTVWTGALPYVAAFVGLVVISYFLVPRLILWLDGDEDRA